jgi:hypothetical protein
VKIFISWSGAGSKSHTLATAFHDWLPNVFQTIETFMSSDTLVAGERWQGGLSKALEECDFGIACLTPKSYHANWILFECGALAKKVDLARVVPVLCDVTNQMMSGHPLTMFNNVNLDEKGIRKLVEAINISLTEHKLSKEKLDAAFEKWWPDFQAHLKNVKAAADEEPREKFELEPAIEEILALLRSLSRRPMLPTPTLNVIPNALAGNQPLLLQPGGPFASPKSGITLENFQALYKDGKFHVMEKGRPVADAGRDTEANPPPKQDDTIDKKKPPT